jgi:hypothetical protein
MSECPDLSAPTPLPIPLAAVPAALPGTASVPTPGPFVPLWAKDLHQAAEPAMPWLWQGYLAPGNVTLLTSQWKAGKTTLIAHLLARLEAGGDLGGLTVRPGKVAIISEESPQQWYHRSQKLHFGGHVCWFCRPFRGKPRRDDWLALLAHLLQLRAEHGLDLVIIDPLAAFLPGRSENDAGAMMDVLLPLQQLTAQDVAVLMAHHPRKGQTLAGQAARGSGALSGYVDILIEMHWYARHDDGDRRRRLQAYSRHEATPRDHVIELTADGTAYVSLGDFAQDEFTESWQLLHAVLDAAPSRLTRLEILERWPSPFKAPNEVTLWRWLERAVKGGLVLQQGTGRRSDPYRYWLQSQEEKWRIDPFHFELPSLDFCGLSENSGDVLDQWMRGKGKE